MPHAIPCHKHGLFEGVTRCPVCAAEWKAKDEQRRRNHPRRAVYADTRWSYVKRHVIARDGYRCVKCGRHRDELGPKEKLNADHIVGVMLLPGQEFEVKHCQTLCSRCSGRKDGARAKQRVRQPSDEARREVRQR